MELFVSEAAALTRDRDAALAAAAGAASMCGLLLSDLAEAAAAAAAAAAAGNLEADGCIRAAEAQVRAGYFGSVVRMHAQLFLDDPCRHCA